jgi:hypothetical protein
MKLKVTISCAVLALGLLIGISSAQAQVDEIERANIPFDFYAGGQKMPAGTYMIWADVEAKTIRISNASGDKSIFLMGIPAGDGYDKSELVFDHSGSTYALEEVKSDLIDLTFATSMPQEVTEGRLALPTVEVALNRL